MDIWSPNFDSTSYKTKERNWNLFLNDSQRVQRYPIFHLNLLFNVFLCKVSRMSGKEPTEAQKAQFLAQARAQINQQFMQDLLHKVTDQCFTKCTSTSGNGLNSSEKS